MEYAVKVTDCQFLIATAPGNTMDPARRSTSKNVIPAARTIATFTTAVLLLSGFPNSHAQWTSDSTANTAVCTSAGTQSDAAISSDGAGGFFVAWQDYRNSNLDVYAQRLGAYGTRAWQASGIPVCIAPGNQKLIATASDGFGGMLLVWQDERISEYDANIYAQRIDSTGSLLWTSTGVAVCTATSNQLNPAITSDGHGGAIIAWIDNRTDYQTDIYAQHLDASGVAKWAANGIQVRAKAGSVAYPRLIGDERGGAMVAWNQSDLNLSNRGVYAQRIDSSGTLKWGDGGIAARLTDAQFAFPSVIPDGAGGAILTWAEPLGTTYNDIAAQRIDRNGNLLWGASGVSVCTAAGPQNSPELTSDLKFGAIISWTDTRASSSNSDIYVQRVDSSGAMVWKADGVAVCTAPGYQQSQKIVSDGLGGALISWRDQRNGTYYRIYGQHIDRNGSVRWQADGRSVCFKNGDNQSIVMLPDHLGGAFLAWEYYTGSDLYAQHVTGAGALGDPALMIPEQLLPQADAIGLGTSPGFSWTPIVGATSFQLQVANDFSFSGSLIFDDSTITDTIKVVGGLLHNATYFWRVRASNSRMIGPFSTDRRFLTAVEAPTPPVLLSPSTNSSAQADSVTLSWQKSSPTVLKYYVEHSEDSLFAAAKADSTNDTTFVLRGLVNNRTYFWRVRARNAGGYSAYSEVRRLFVTYTAVSVEARFPLDFELHQNYPNPFNPLSTIRYGLPNRAHVLLTVFNTVGQEVAILVSEEKPAGYHEVRFDGTGLSSGVYYYRLSADNFILSRKLLLVR